MHNQEPSSDQLDSLWNRNSAKLHAQGQARAPSGPGSKGYALKRCLLAVTIVLADGALKLVIRSGLRVGGGRSTLHGPLIYPQRDRTRRLVGYGFDRNKMMLLSQAQEPACDDVYEAQVPVVIDVKVRHLTDVSNPGVKDTLLAQFVVRGTRMLMALQPNKVHGNLPSIPIHPYHFYYQYLRILSTERYVFALGG
jgi:hypothetical protein